MANDWFCKIAGKEFGPLSSEQLRIMVAEGSLTPSHQVKHGGGGAWFSASEVSGLFETFPSVVPQAVPQTPPMQPVGPLPSFPQVQPPVAPPVSPSGLPQRSEAVAATMAQHKRKRRERNLLIGSFVAVILSTIIGIIILLTSGPKPTEATKKAPAAVKPVEEKRAAQPPARKTVAEELEPDLSGVSTAPILREQPKEKTAASAPPVAAETPWIDASKKDIRRGDWTIRVKAADVGVPVLLTQDDKPAVPNRQYVVITLELTNENAASSLVYEPWNEKPQGAILSDDAGKGLDAANFRMQRYRLEGQVVGRDSVAAGASLEDRLAFAKPPEDAKFLRLQLSGESIGDKEPLRFEIPKKMLGALPVPDANAKE